jgi:chromosome segregation ATPase
MSTSESAPADLVTEIERRGEELDAAQQRVEEYGEAELQELADAYGSWAEMLDRFQDQVTGDDGDIQTIVAFQSRIDEVMGEISADTLRYEIFEECDEYLQQKWFSDSDFEHVYDRLEPVGELVKLLEDRNEAREAYRETRKKLSFRYDELAAELDDLERLAALTDADLDAPTERIRDPIESYNDAVAEAFREFYREKSARTVVTFLEQMEWYPLVEFESPPPEITEYIRNYPPGTETVP